MFSCLFHFCYSATRVSAPARGNSLHHNYGINAAKRGEKTNCNEKGREEREVGSFLMAWKERGALHLEPGVELISNYPPDDQPAFEVDWLPGVCWGRKFLRVPDPCRPRGRPPRDPGALDAPRVHQSCNPSLSDVRQQMLLPVGSIYLATPDPLHPAKETQRIMKC